MTDIVERLRDTPNWQRQSFEHWKTATSVYDRAPFEAADEIERLRAELSHCGRDTCMGKRVAGLKQWVTLDAYEALRAERDALRELLCECRIALMWPGGPAQAFLDRIDAATASRTTGTEPGAEGA